MTWWQTALVTVAPVLFALVVTNVADNSRNLEEVKRGPEGPRSLRSDPAQHLLDTGVRPASA